MLQKMGNAQSAWKLSFKKISEYHSAAYNAIDEAISLEEQEKPNDALEKYKEGILFIDKALDVRVSCDETNTSTWREAIVMIQKMKKTRAECLTRINSINSSSNFVPSCPPPEVSEASNTSTNIPQTYSDLADALQTLPLQKMDSSSEESIFKCDNVTLYFISPDGAVSQALEPQTLNISVISDDESGTNSTVFLQVGGWVYPLIAGVSPCYRTEYGAFILPDVHSNIEGFTVGIILPSDADASVYEMLESILLGVVSQTSQVMKSSVIPAAATFSDKVSNAIVTGSYYLSRGLIFGAQKLGSLMNYGTPKIMNIITPESQATEISPSVAKGFEIASTATSKASQFTGYVAEKVGLGTQALARYLAPHIQQQGTRLLTSGFKLSEDEAQSKVNGILTIAAGAVEGFSTVYTGLETSAVILGKSISNNTVKIVNYKYGGPASQVATNTFNTMGNVITIGHHSRFFTPKGIVKIAAKETGKAVTQQHVCSEDNSSFTNLYPSLSGLQRGESSVDNKLSLKEA